MPYLKQNATSLRYVLVISILLTSFASLSAHAQSSTPPQSPAEPSPSAFIIVEPNRGIGINVEFSYETALAAKYNFARILSAALHCDLQDKHLSLNDDGMTEISGRCDFPLRRTLLMHSGEIDLQPFKDLFHNENDYVIGASVRMPGNDFVRCDPKPNEIPEVPGESVCVYLLKGSSAGLQNLHFEFGYDRARTIRTGSFLGFLLVVPILLTFWFRRRALSVREKARPALSFAHRRFLTWTASLGMIAWWTSIDLLHADEYMSFVLPALKWTDSFAADIFPWILLWIPPVAVYFLCLVLSSPLQTLRGTNHSQREIFGRSFWAVARFAMPLSLMAVSVAIMDYSARIAFLICGAAIFLGGFAMRRFARAYGFRLHALSSGELRDRAFALASAAGTKLNQLYVLPTERMRMANAFAHSAHNIYLTDYLVNNLSKREVDAILGHEIAHLQKKHLGRRMTIMFVAVLGMVFGTAFAEYWLPRGFPVGPVVLSLILLLSYFMSRKNEFAADAGSVQLTGDAEAMITGLVKISRLNVMPIHWGRVDEKLLTHPSTLRRIKQLARDGGIPEARIPELLSQTVAPPEAVYLIPATALPAGKAFSTEYKARSARRYAWTTVLIGSLIPSLIAYAAQWGRTGNLFLWATYFTGLVLTIAAETLIGNFFARRGLPKLEGPLREKAKSEGFACVDRGLFVGIAPDCAPRIYEGQWVWDLGILSVTPEEFIYWGEEARFVLRRTEITSISVGAGSVSWHDNSSVYVTWRDSTGRDSVFNVRPLRSISAQVLAQTLESWHLGVAIPNESVLAITQPAAESLGAPKFGQVTSTSPRIMVRVQSLVRVFRLNTAVAFGMVFALGLYFPPLDVLAGVSGSAYVNPAGGAVYVLAVVLLTQIFLLIPYWRFREANSPSAVASARTTPAD